MMLIRILSSVKLTVICLILLFILTFWGTIDQIYNGLYLAQEKFFHSFYFLAFGFLPFPGGQLVLWILFVNLFCAAAVRFRYLWSNIGLLIIHFGLLTFFIAAYVTLHCVRESHVTFYEGEATNVSSAYHDWELSVWSEEGHKKKVLAFDAKSLHSGQNLPTDLGTIKILQYFPNAEAYSQEKGQNVLNVSGIGILKPVALNKEPEKNLPGIIFELQEKNTSDKKTILLYGGEREPLQVKDKEQTYHFMLRTKRFALPFMVKLLDFMMERHPGTEIARSYKSKVTIETPAGTREVLISMNNPLRYKNFTMYQASYAIEDNTGREISTLAVVENAGRILPYVASLVTFTGLMIHFLAMAFRSREEQT